MPRPSDRWKARKFTRTPGGKTKMSFFTEKSGKKTCALCEAELHGVPHGKRVAEVSKLSKTEKRPSGIFGGVLCGNCRTEIIEETAKVKTGVKNLSDVSFEEKKYVEMAMNRVGE